MSIVEDEGKEAAPQPQPQVEKSPGKQAKVHLVIYMNKCLVAERISARQLIWVHISANTWCHVLGMSLVMPGWNIICFTSMMMSLHGVRH